MQYFSYYRKEGLADYFLKEKKEIAKRKKQALERKDAATAKLRDLVFMEYKSQQPLELPDCTEEARKAHADAKKMVKLFGAEEKRMEAEIIFLGEQEKALDHSTEVLKNF